MRFYEFELKWPTPNPNWKPSWMSEPPEDPSDAVPRPQRNPGSGRVMISPGASGWDEIDDGMFNRLKQLSANAGTAVVVTSAVRAYDLQMRFYNQGIGAHPDASTHVQTNTAVDIRTRNLDDATIARLVVEASKLGFTGIGFYSGNNAHLHIDMGGQDVGRQPRVWGVDKAGPRTGNAMRLHRQGRIDDYQE